MFISIKDQVEFAMGKEDATTEVPMCRTVCQSFNTMNESLVDRLTSKTIDKFVVVDIFVGIVFDLIRGDDDSLLLLGMLGLCLGWS